MAPTNKKSNPPKTPASNAGSGVVDDEPKTIDETEVRTFNSGGLWPIAAVADDGNRIGSIADVAYFSGLFPGATPATLAIRILAGQSLGMDAAQALFDLEVEPGPIVRYRPAGRTFEIALDEVEALQAARRKTLEPKSAVTPDPALGSKTTPETASNVVKGPFSGENEASIAIAYQKSEDLANKGPLTKPDGETPKDADGTGNVEARPGNVEARAESTPTTEPAPGSETTESALSAAKNAEAVGQVDGRTVQAWRDSIAAMCKDLGVNPDEKTKTFDSKPITEKKKYFDEVFKYYSGKVREITAYVLDRLKEDGKTSADSQKGFFIYAEVSFDPAAWTYGEAKKAEAVIGEFLKSKGSPKPAA